MRTKLFKLVVVLLIAGSGDTRPQRSDVDVATQPEATRANNAGWRAIRSSNKSHDIVRDDSRYTGTSGSNRKSYITHFRDSVDLLREHNAVSSRASGLATNEMLRSFSARRSRIDDIWTLSESEGRGGPSDVSRTDETSGRISEIATFRNSNKLARPSFHGPLVNPREIQDGKTDWVRSVLASNKSSNFETNSYSGEASHSQRVGVDNLKKSKPGVTLSPSYKSVLISTRYSPAGNNSVGSRAFGLGGTSVADVTPRDDVRIAEESRQMVGSVRSNLSSNQNIVGNNVLVRGIEQGSHISSSSSSASSQTEIRNVWSSRRADAPTRSTHQSRDSLYKITDGAGSIIGSYEDLKSRVVADPPRHVDNVRRDGLNNSGEPVREVQMRPTLIQKSKSRVGGHGRPASRRKTVTSNRNFVRLRRPAYVSNSRFNRVVKPRVEGPPNYRPDNHSNVAPNQRDWAKLKTSDGVRFTADETEEPAKSSHLTQSAAKLRSDPNEQAMHEATTTRRHSSDAQKLPSQSVSDSRDSTRFSSGTPIHNANPKNWPNGALQDIEDLYNYEKYTASLVESSHPDPGVQGTDQASVASLLSSHGVYINHTDPVLDSSVKKIIQWLKIPPIVPNNTHFPIRQDDVHKPIESVLESIYENLEPNRPLNVGVHDGNYETVIVHDAASSQGLDRIDYHSYPHRPPNPPTSVASTVPLNFPDAPLPTAWSEATLTKNNNVHNPTTHVSQNTVVHILNDGLKKPNVTVTQLKTPQSNIASGPTVQETAASGEEAASEAVQRPNVHIMFTSQKDEDRTPAKHETSTFPAPSGNTNCPTIMINSYTRVNNTIQSKEGCTDLNIIINSHILNTNVFKPSAQPTEAEQQTTSVATQSYADESNKYAGAANNDLVHQDSSNSYVTASADSYGSSSSFQSPYPPAVPSDYYDSQKDPVGVPSQESVSPELSTVEVFQGTQISISSPYVPLQDTETAAGPVVDGAAGASVDGPGVGDDASNSVPPAGGASAVAGGASGSPAGNAPATVPAVALPMSGEPGTVMGLANNGLIPSGTLQLPSLPNLPSRPSLPGRPGSSGGLSSSHGSAGSSSHHGGGDDDDDDDDFDITPGSMLQSITSVFTYFTFLNPLSYSFFSLTAAPFAAMAAGVLGVAAFIFPWAFPSAFDFGRATDKVAISFRPSLEEFVRRAVHKYDRLNEWKSKRRKRRR